jgi:hypothetical protein
MKKILIVSALLLSISGTALAGSRYDECIKEEKALKAQEAGDCSGLKYLLNPTACFATQKALKVYASGRCKQIGIAENVDFSVPKVIPEKKSSKTVNASSAVSVNTIEQVSEKKADRAIPQQEYTIEQLKEENTRLKNEISRLNRENEQLRKTGH